MENQYNFRDEEKCFAMQIENILRGYYNCGRYDFQYQRQGETDCFTDSAP